MKKYYMFLGIYSDFSETMRRITELNVPLIIMEYEHRADEYEIRIRTPNGALVHFDLNLKINPLLRQSNHQTALILG